MRALGSLMVGLALATAIPLAAAAAPPADVAAAVAAPGRSADNVKLDANRKPAELLAFLGLKRGMRVLDMFGGNRYWAEIVAPAVGPRGAVTVWEPAQFYDQDTFDKFVPFQAATGNTRLIVSPFEAPDIGTNAYDFTLINLDYHDVYWESAKYGIVRMEPDAWLKTLYTAMKPGAVVAVVDHVATGGGNPREVVEKLHRIDPALVRADFERAGFEFVGESDMLRNPADDHSLLVFDPKIRGRTDRFVFKYRKPR